jgi:chorismate mutase
MELSNIASILESLEETIIFKLIDRAQFSSNSVIYESGKSEFPGEERSLFELRIFYQESMDAIFGRFMCPEERPFCKDLPVSKRDVTPQFPELDIDNFNKINLTEKIKNDYLSLIPEICINGDDNQYGSSVEHDIYALQAISRRIHFGSFFITECKFQDDPEGYIQLIKERNSEEILKKLTRPEIEEKILSRVREKVAYAQEKVNRNIRKIINPDIILNFYKKSIIPLTKEGEILYLYNRNLP